MGPAGDSQPTRYRAEHLLTLEDDPVVVSPGIVDIADGKVLWSGPEADAPLLDGPSHRLGGLLMPGFVNTHAHTPMVLLRGAGEGLAVDRWLTEVMWPREGRLEPEDVHWGMTLGAAELLAGGVTTSHEMYFLSDALAAAAVSAGLRCVVTPPILASGDLARFGTWEQQISATLDQAHRWSGHELISIGFGPHAAYTVPEESLRTVAELAARQSMHIHIHVAEGRHEGDDIQAMHGMSVPRFLEHTGMLEVPLVAAHGIWLSEGDIDIFAKHAVGVAHCPMSNGKHASGIAPVATLRSRGVPVGVATDGPSSHDRLDVFEEMRAAIRLARLRDLDAAVLGPSDALVMATREAGAVLGRSDLGTLSPGSRADMILIDTEPLVPVVEPADLITHLVYSGSPDLVNTVWIEGRQVVVGGEAATVDVTEARRQVETRARRLAS